MDKIWTEIPIFKYNEFQANVLRGRIDYKPM